MTCVKPGHANQDPVRYEMRRQWVVEGNLKELSASHLCQASAAHG